MDEIKLQNIRPVGGQRPAERQAPKEPTAERPFEQTLASEVARMDSVQKNLTGPAETEGAAKAASIKEEIRTANKMFEDLLKSKQVLSQLYHNIDNSDKS